ncbi:MAG: hypothetical protein PHH09_11335, partial [Methanoregulaceae archaeon]|nr:hypothetical protein [Methanoregulaceae archaeon]
GNLRRRMALRELVWAGLMNRIHVVGAIRPHTPHVRYTPPPPNYREASALDPGSPAVTFRF